MEGDVASGASLGDEAGGRGVDRVAGYGGAFTVVDWAGAASAVGDSRRGRGERGVDEDVIARVAVGEGLATRRRDGMATLTQYCLT